MRLFASAFTQWHVGPGGVVGLRYEALPVLRDAHGIPADEWPQALADLQVMEQRALEFWREQRATRKG